jgi:hypothetical protein
MEGKAPSPSADSSECQPESPAATSPESPAHHPPHPHRPPSAASVLVPPLLLLYKFLGDLLKVHKRSAFEVIFSVLLTLSQGVNDPLGFRRRRTRRPIAKQCKAINLHSLLANQLKAIRNINSIRTCLSFPVLFIYLFNILSNTILRQLIQR